MSNDAQAVEAIHAAICEESLTDHMDPDWPGKCVKAAIAADSVMFSEAAIERAAKALRAEFSVDDQVGEYDATAVWGTPADIARAVVAALREEA
jgi:hypothetical protein